MSTTLWVVALTPTSIKAPPKAIEAIDAIAAYLADKSGRRIGRGQAIEELLRQYRPPQDLTPAAAAVRRTHKEFVS